MTHTYAPINHQEDDVSDSAADVSSTEADEMIDAEWTWLYDDHDAGTVFITDDPENRQFPIAEGLTAAQATDIIEVHNKTVRALAEAASLNTSASRSPAPEVVEAPVHVSLQERIDAIARALYAAGMARSPVWMDKDGLPRLPAEGMYANLRNVQGLDLVRLPNAQEWAERKAALPAQREPARAADAARHTTPELDVELLAEAMWNDGAGRAAHEQEYDIRDLYSDDDWAVVNAIAAAYRDATREPAPADEGER